MQRRGRPERPGGATPSNVLLDSFSDFLGSILSLISSSVVRVSMEKELIFVSRRNNKFIDLIL
jgi:hypothetical protein